jgi:hypothetical protein
MNDCNVGVTKINQNEHQTLAGVVAHMSAHQQGSSDTRNNFHSHSWIHDLIEKLSFDLFAICEKHPNGCYEAQCELLKIRLQCYANLLFPLSHRLLPVH